MSLLASNSRAPEGRRYLRWARVPLSQCMALCLCLLLAGCVNNPIWVFRSGDVPPLQLDGEIYTTDDALALARPSVLAIDDEMRDFVALHARPGSSSRTRLMSLHQAVKGSGMLDLQYDPFADGDAMQAFHRGSANCLSYAHMFIALAREAGLKADYQWMELRPEWQRFGERIAVRLHVNVRITTRDGTEYVVDIDPVSRGEVAGSRILTDYQGLALHYNNLAMTALTHDDPAAAWMKLVQGIKAAPGLSQLWVNLGAVYRLAGQYDDAERAYFRALDIDSGDRSAMNNLVVLYETQGRDQERDYWLDRLSRYREQNPYYYAGLGDRAMNDGDWEEAHKHYARANRMQPGDSQLIYSLGLAEHRLGNVDKAEELIAEAIELAAFQLEKQEYRILLRNIQNERAASL